MQWIIGRHPKCDTDTNAAIAGAMIGAKYGQERLLASEITTDNWLILEAAPLAKTDLKRPKLYSVRVLFPLLRNLLTLVKTRPSSKRN